MGQPNPDRQGKHPRIERKFAEQRRYHSSRQARYWGLAKVTVQALITCIVANCKPLAKLWESICSRPRGTVPAERDAEVKDVKHRKN